MIKSKDKYEAYMNKTLDDPLVDLKHEFLHLTNPQLKFRLTWSQIERYQKQKRLGSMMRKYDSDRFTRLFNLTQGKP